MRNKKVKIIATLGPSINEVSTIEQMILKGVNVFRINCSHTKENEIEEYVKLVRKASDNLDVSVAVFADLQGPKIRIGNVAEKVNLKTGEEIFLVHDDKLIGNKEKISVSFKEILNDTQKGETILLDDGKIILEVLENQKTQLKTKIIQGGLLKSKKGLNLPNTKLSIYPITENDIKNLKEALKNEIDWIALSFVRNKKDIEDLRELINENSDYQVPIISKIERPEAVNNIDEIIDISDAIMVARGDLGLETSYDMLPLLQKEIISKCIDKSKPVIVATQLLESMVEGITPSRSDASDIANAVIDGADTLMLSAETSTGKNPIIAVEKMANIIYETEKYLSTKLQLREFHSNTKINQRYITNIICAHSAYISIQDREIKSINTITQTGYSAKELASMRPACKIMAFCYDERIKRSLSLIWGIETFSIECQSTLEQTLTIASNKLKEKNILKKGDRVINLIAIGSNEENQRVDTLRINEIS